MQICPANLDSCSPPHPASSNDVSAVSLTVCLPSLGITHCIPWKSCSLGCRSDPRHTENIEDKGSTNTALLQHSCQLYCPALSHNLLSAWSTDWAARHLQILDNEPQLHTSALCTASGKSWTDRGTACGQQKPGRFGMEVYSYCTCASHLLSMSDIIPGTWGSLHTRPARVMHSGCARHCIHVRSAVHTRTAPPQGKFAPESHCFSLRNVPGSCAQPG